MDEYPDTFAVIQIHQGDDYASEWGQTRINFYGVTAYPTFFYDGLWDAWPYTTYASKFVGRQAVATDVTVAVVAAQQNGPTFEVSVTVCVEEDGAGKPMRVYAAQVLDNQPQTPSYSRNCAMQGATLGDIMLLPGQCETLTTTFTFDDESWSRPEDIRIIAWAQEPESSGPAEVFQAGKLSWPFSALVIRVPDGVPEFIDPDTDTGVFVQIDNAGESYVSGTGTLHYRYDDGDFSTAPLLELGDNQFLATLPAPGCDAVPEYYFSATGHLGTTVYEPAEAPDVVFSGTVATVTTYIEDDFETDQGWTVENDPSLTGGAWERAVPSTDGSYGEPTVDYDDSGHCFVTENTHQGDVDRGPTHVISPKLDVSGANNPMLRFAYWFACDDTQPPSQDYLVVALSNNDGVDWVDVATYETTLGWVKVDLALADYLPPTDMMKVRFTTSDNPNNSKTEAAVDAIWLYDLSCSPGLCAGDLNCDGVVDFDDIDPFVAALGCQGGDPNCWDPTCPWLNGDCNSDETVNFDDIDPFVGRIGAECP